MVRVIKYYRRRALLLFGRVVVQASRWPWQEGYNWKGMTSSSAPLNNGSRFGGGWAYKLGVSVGGSTVMVDLLFGMVTFGFGKYTMKQVAQENPQ